MKKIFLLLFVGIFALGFSQKKKKTKSKAVVEKETVIIYTEQEAETSKETRVIAGFIKQNPSHARTDFFKKRLMEIIMADNSPEAKPTIRPISKEKIEKIVKNNELNSGKVIAANKTSTANNTKNADTKNTDKLNDAINALKEERLASYASAGAAKSAGSSAKGPSEANKKTAAMLTHLFNNDINKNEAYINIKNRSSCNLIVKISGKKYYNLSVPARGENFILIDKGEYVLTTMVCDAKYSSLKKITQDIEIALNVAD